MQKNSVVGALHGLQLSNFKCHQETPEIELAPITLLVGQNTSGKTALIQPLLLLKQTIELKASSVAPLVLNGNYVSLGAFNEIVYNHDKRKSIGLRVKVVVPLNKVNNNYFIQRNFKNGFGQTLDVDCFINIVYSEDEQRLYLSEIQFKSKLFFFDIKPIEEIINVAFMDDKFTLKLNQSVQWHNLWLQKEQNLRSVLSLLPIITRPVYISQKYRLQNVKRMILQVLMRNTVDAFLATIENIGYIGPLREMPTRYYFSSGEKVSDVGVSGEDAVEVLHQDKVLGGDLTKNLNFWLRKLEVAQAVKLKTVDPFLYSLEIVSPCTKTQVNITGTGFGVSQIIPAIVQGHIMPQQSTLILEQPEIHLHPKAQATIADLLIDLALKGKRFLVETHSEHLILRIQRRVAEGVLEPDYIRIFYFNTTKEGSEIRKMSVDKTGELLNFPEGFMEEGMQEALKMALASSSKRSKTP